MHKVVVTEKKDMYREINTYFIKTKEQYSVQWKAETKPTSKLTT